MNRVRNILVALGVGVVFIAAFMIISAVTEKPQKAYDFSYAAVDGSISKLYTQARDTGAVLIFIDPALEGSNSVLSSIVENAGEVPVIAVSVTEDTGSDTLALLPENARGLKNLVLDGEDIEQLYNVSDRAPITYFINSEFYVTQAFVGNIKEETVIKCIENLSE